MIKTLKNLLQNRRADCSLRHETLQMQTTYEVNKVCEYSRSMSFHYDLILQDQASGERSQDQWSSGIGIGSVLVRQQQRQNDVNAMFGVIKLI